MQNITGKLKGMGTHVRFFAFLSFTLILASCMGGGGGGGGGAIGHSDSTTTPPSATVAQYSFQEQYSYGSDCTAALLHNCMIETKMDIGETVNGTCTIETSDVAANTCFPDTLKNTILATQVPSLIVRREEQNKYLIILTLTQGHRDVFEVSDLSALDLSQSNEQVGKL